MRSLILLSLILSYSISFAQDNLHNIRGQVYDISNNQPLPGATVSIINSDLNIGTITDPEGGFSLEGVPLGRHDISISFLGYSTYIQKGVLVRNAEDVMLKIKLKEQSKELEQVIVTSDQRLVTNEAAIVSAKSFPVEELSKIPGGMDDPARVVRKFPGVSPAGSITVNEINIRGNASRANRWRLEDMDIYNPNHFGVLSGSGGSLTIFSQRLLTNTDFFSGAFPADYGNALGGVFDMRFRNGNTTKRQHSIQIGLLGIDVATEGPIGKKGNSSYLANYRYSTTGLLDGFLNLGGVPVFQDLSFKIHHTTSQHGVFNVFGIGGKSSLSYLPAMDTTQWTGQWSNLARINRNITGTIGASYIHPVNKNTYIKSIVLGTGIQLNQVRYYQNYDLITADTTRLGQDKDFRFSWQSYINHRFNNKHQHRSGVMIHRLQSNVNYRQVDEGRLTANTSLTDTLRYGQGSAYLMQFYSRSQLYLNNSWQLNIGIHAMLLTMTGELSIEPRIGLKYNLTNRSSLNLAYGLHSQMEPFFSYISLQKDESTNTYRRLNDDLRFNKAHHLTVGFYNQVNDLWNLGIEAYYQRQWNLATGVHYPISRVGGYDFIFESFDLNHDGTGHHYGIELAVERTMENGFYFIGNTSLFEANYMANDGVKRPSQYNARYVLNVVGGKEWAVGQKRGKSNFLNINLSSTYGGSQYYTPIDLDRSIASGYYIGDYSRPNELQQDPLLLVDASIIYKKNRKRSNTQWVLQANNMLNRRSVIGADFDRENARQILQLGTGFLPILSWRISF
ncbi:MAG: TonB-dependent receptor [Cyclobacteriaceae bacterium]